MTKEEVELIQSRKKGNIFVCVESVIEGEHEWRFPLAVKGQVFFFNNEALARKDMADFHKHFKELRVNISSSTSYAAEIWP